MNPVVRVLTFTVIVLTVPLWGWWVLACTAAERDPWHPTRTTILLGVLVALLAATSAFGQDRDVTMSAKSAAELGALAKEVPALAERVDGLEAARKTDKQVIAGLCTLADIKDQIILGHRSLLALAYEGEARRAEQLAETRHDASKEVRKAAVIAGASAGGAIGTAVFPGIGTLVGLGIGATVGFFSTPAPETPPEHLKPRELPKLEIQAPPKVCLPAPSSTGQ